MTTRFVLANSSTATSAKPALLRTTIATGLGSGGNEKVPPGPVFVTGTLSCQPNLVMSSIARRVVRKTSARGTGCPSAPTTVPAYDVPATSAPAGATTTVLPPGSRRPESPASVAYVTQVYVAPPPRSARAAAAAA